MFLIFAIQHSDSVIFLHVEYSSCYTVGPRLYILYPSFRPLTPNSIPPSSLPPWQPQVSVSESLSALVTSSCHILDFNVSGIIWYVSFSNCT